MNANHDEAERLEGSLLVHLSTWCADCGREADVAELRAKYEQKHTREYAESFYRFCRKGAVKLLAEGWRFPHQALPYCPDCWARRQSN
jgi:hypothetical protein